MFTNTKTSDIEFDQLNAKCLIQISKFARVLYRLNGTILRLQESNIMEQITYHYEHNDNAELHNIYMQLRLEIIDIVCDLQLENSLMKFSMPNQSSTRQQILN